MENISKIPKLSLQEILPWFNQLDMVDACITQLQKDLVSYGVQLNYSGNSNSAYSELYTQLVPQISDILIKAPSKIQEILYRVDVSEVAFAEIKSSNEPLSEAVSRLILCRELQKVVTWFLLKK